METELKSPLNPIQLELLKMFARKTTDEELLEIKKLLTKYFYEKTTKHANEVWERNHWTQADMDRLLHTHFRTPYK